MKDIINNKEWSQVITPKTKWYDIKLKEVWEYRDLIMIFVRRDIVAAYKQTILGPLWMFLGPLFTVVVYTLVFNKIANISTEGIPAPLFYLGGTTLWNYFSACFSGTSGTFVANAEIFGKVYFPRLVSPISVVVSNLVKFGIQMIMFLAFYFYYYFQEGSVIEPTYYLFSLPILVVLMGGIALGTGVLVSAFTTKYRDINYFISFGVTLLMYATPVIYPVSSIPASYRFLIDINPITPIIENFRYSFTGQGSFDASGLIYSGVFMLVVLCIGAVSFSRVEKTFMDTV